MKVPSLKFDGARGKDPINENALPHLRSEGSGFDGECLCRTHCSMRKSGDHKRRPSGFYTDVTSKSRLSTGSASLSLLYWSALAMSFRFWESPDPVDPHKTDRLSVFLQRVQSIPPPKSETLLVASVVLGVLTVSLVFVRYLHRRVQRKRTVPARIVRERTPETEATAESVDYSHFVYEHGRLVRRSPR